MPRQRAKTEIPNFHGNQKQICHVLAVDTFEKCFEQTNSYNQLKKLFGIDEEGESLEKDMEYIFITLSMDIAMTLNKIKDRIHSEMAVKYTLRRFTEAIKIKRAEYKSKYPENAIAVDDFIKFIKNDLIAEVDQKIKDNVHPHV